MLLVERLLVYSRTGWVGGQSCNITNQHTDTEQFKQVNKSVTENNNIKTNKKVELEKTEDDGIAVCPDKPVVTAETIGRIGN